MTYIQRMSFIAFNDSLCVLAAIFLSSSLLNGSYRYSPLIFLVSAGTLLFSHHYFSYRNKLYKKAWEYASVGELFIIIKVITFSNLVTSIVQLLLLQDLYVRLLSITWMLHLLLIGGTRFGWRMYRDLCVKQKSPKKRTLIIGAGAAGTMVVRQLLNSKDAELLPVVFIDDDVKKQHLDILGIPVIGCIDMIESTVEHFEIDNIVIAIPSLSKKELNKIFLECAKTKVKTQILPMLEDLVMGKVSVNQFRDVQVEDLLGREPVELNVQSISEYVTQKVVLVTGAGGSIGSEICRQIAQFNPRKLVLLGHGENSIYSIEMELRDRFDTSKMEIVTEIADLQDTNKMMDVMRFHYPNVVYHAAAHKHVPLMERNPEEAIKNNLIGTINIAKAASWHHVETFVMISTDKAVNPTSVMGASKRLAEMMIQSLDKMSTTKFVAVRFGNVLGSRGSVIPRFKKQIQEGGPVTVTHPDMVRYFMTIPEASRLVLQAGALAKGGEIFVLDMGDPVKIVDLAKNLIKLTGYSVEEIGIEYTGIRPGEKLFEELLKEDEVYEEQIYPKIYIGKTVELFIEEIEELISNYSNFDRDTLRKKIVQLANQRTFSKKLLMSS